jgi:putative ABC transport system permease protein
MQIHSVAKLVLRGLLARKGRSFLTILGIIIGVAGVIIIIALGAGAQHLVLSQVTKFGTNLLSVMPGKSDESGAPSQAYGIQITTLTAYDAEALRDKNRVPHALGVIASVTGNDFAVWKGNDSGVNFVGTEYDYPNIVNLGLSEGRFFDERESKGGANVVVIGWQVKEELFGDQNPIGEIIKIKNVPLVVIGVIEKRGSFMFQNQDAMIFMPLTVAQKQILGINHVLSISLKVDQSENIQSTINDVETLLKERHNIKRDEDMDFSVFDIAEAVKIFTQVTDALRMFLATMAGIALLVGGIGILNIMLVTVAERTREVGLRKAVGAKNSVILKQFLVESATLTLIGGLFGIIAGVAVSFLVSLGAQYAGFDWPLIISFYSIVLAVGVSILTGVVFGLYPAYKAAKLNPIDALRYE